MTYFFRKWHQTADIEFPPSASVPEPVQHWDHRRGARGLQGAVDQPRGAHTEELSPVDGYWTPKVPDGLRRTVQTTAFRSVEHISQQARWNGRAIFWPGEPSVKGMPQFAGRRVLPDTRSMRRPAEEFAG